MKFNVGKLLKICNKIEKITSVRSSVFDEKICNVETNF